jgi:hypothetical protein
LFGTYRKKLNAQTKKRCFIHHSTDHWLVVQPALRR